MSTPIQAVVSRIGVGWVRSLLWPLSLAVVMIGELGFFIHGTEPRETFPLDLAVSTCSIVAGLVVWNRRPDNRIGPLLVLVGWLWAIGGIRSFEHPVAFGVGEWLAD